ncbi:MAG: apolipoprotein N-acyltransferase [Gammaproteobacteria bacterium]|nr:apolipoprotein N-acyltransferase [Gammaproteobacteria bacterium]NNL51338.1 apolipoprotein N-acyltransferase [Woeseiaceae bacterium]
MAKDLHPFLLLPADRPRLSRLFVFLLGCGMSLGFAPWGLSFLAPLLVLPLLFICMIVSPRDAASHAFWFGLGMFLTGTYWIYISVHVYGNAALWIAFLLMIGLAIIMASFIAIAGWLISRLSQGEFWQMVFVAPAAWVLVEWLRGWAFTGFPWLALGYGQIDGLFAGWAPVLGVYGVSFMLMFSTSAAIVAFMLTGVQRIIGVLAILVPWLAGGALLMTEWTESAGEPIRTTIVQAGVSQDQKWQRNQLMPIMAFYRNSTLNVPDSKLVVWPEVAIPALDDQVDGYINRVQGDVRARKQNVVFGILERSSHRGAEARIYNSVFLLGDAGRQVYRKRHLVPFGEYFPVPDGVREWMKMQNLPYSDLAAGEAIQPLLVTDIGTRLAAAICYEDAYGAEQLYAFPDANILINVSNDAWFGDSIAPHQHLEIARMRALEVGRNAVRSTNTGISAFIGSDGDLLHVGKQFEPQVITANIEPRRGMTPYASTGNRPIIGICLAIIAFFWIRNRASL